jgi:hypothetical protein
MIRRSRVNWGAGSLAIMATLCAREAQAKDFRFSRQWTIPARAEALVQVIVAYDETCDKGCRYRAPHVAQALVLGHEREPDSFYVWTFVVDFQDSSWFSHVTIERGAGRIRVEDRLVSRGVADALRRASGKRHAPDFSDYCATYDLEELFDGGRFVATRVSFEEALSIPGLAGLLGSGIVKGRLKEAARSLEQDLRAVGTPGGD